MREQPERHEDAGQRSPPSRGPGPTAPDAAGSPPLRAYSRRLADRRQAAFIERISDCFVSLDADWQVTAANRAAASLFGRSIEDLMGRDLWSLWPESAGSDIERRLRNMLAGGTPEIFEHHFPKSDVWLSIRAYPDETGGLAIFYRDITAEKRLTAERVRLLAEARRARRAAESRATLLWEREEQLAAIFNQAAVGIVQADLEGHFILTNQRYCDLLGYSRDELLARGIDEVTHPDDLPRTRAAIRGLLAGGPTELLEKRYLRADGSPIWLQSTVTLVRNREGVPTSILAVTADLTPQRVAEVERRSNEVRLRLALEAGELGTWELDLHTNAVECSRVFSRIFGYASLEPTWTYDRMLGHVLTADRERVDSGFRNAIADGVAWAVECRIRRADGQIRWVWSRAEPFADASGRVTHFLGVVRDITVERESLDTRERQLARERASRAEAEEARAESDAARGVAETASRLKGEFLAVMSHELRTPLTSIAGYTELLEMGLRGPVTPEQREDLRRIHESERHLRRLIDEVLDYARIETGRVQFEIDDVRLADTVAIAESLIAPQVRAKGLQLSLIPCDLALVARADSEKLQQILLNLLSNAVKFTDERNGEPGRIEVRCTEGGDRVLVHVADTGTGIPADKLEVIFEPFVQVDARLTRVHQGTGLGLAISRDLARGMGGELWAESTMGEGSVFILSLPAAHPSAPRTSIASPHDAP